MKRRQFIAGLGAVAASPVFAQAQQSGRIPVVGLFAGVARAEDFQSRPSFLNGLVEFGYVPGRTVILEERYANEIPERYASFAAEFVNLKVDVVVTQAGAAMVALHRATSTIPIVVVGVGDPVAQGYASSLSKPGRNVSGLTQMSIQLAAKRIQLLQQIISTGSRVALLTDPANLAARAELPLLSAATRELGLLYEVFEVRVGSDFDQAFQEMEEKHCRAVEVSVSSLMYAERKRIVALGLKHRLAVLGPFHYYAEAGTLLSYGPDFPTLWRGAAYFVDKILKGEKVGDIPFQQPTKFELHINLQTAKSLGIEIPPAMLALADKVIE